jgi:hypothetical protein
MTFFFSTVIMIFFAIKDLKYERKCAINIFNVFKIVFMEVKIDGKERY